MLYVGRNTVAPNNVINTGIEQVQSDYAQVDTTAVDYIKNKPTLASVATSGDYSDLSNTPTIPTVNDATLTITQNGTSVGTFTANASSDVTVNLTDTTYTSFVGADGSTAGSSGLVPAPGATDNTKYLKGDGNFSQVAYSEISGTPTIPTVNNATLTITQGGVSKGTFTSNASSDVTIALDAGGGSSYSAGTGISISNNTISVTTPVVQNIATGENAITILGVDNASPRCVNIGADSIAGTNCVAIGRSAKARESGAVAMGRAADASKGGTVAIGYQSKATAENAIILGANGTNSEARSFYVAVPSGSSVASDESTGLYKMMGSNGKIPNGRLDMDTTPTQSSTKPITSGAVYAALGDIETVLDAIIAQGSNA